MADLYGNNNESEDMSSFLQILLHNSSSSAAAANDGIINPSGGFFTSGEAAAMAESDPSSFFNKDSDGFNHSIRMKNLNSNFEGSEGSELPIDPALPRSSKRTRAAEVHNLTEKRRRSRINEKLKALQKLIPNSNKTDKASMLDEAIEYLKQLQLQVQMLTLRNGLGAPPLYSLGSLQSMGVTPAGLELDEGNILLNSNRGPDPHTIFTHGHIQTTNPTSSAHPMIDTNSAMQPSYIPSTQNHYGLLNHLASSKDICRDDTFYRLQLDMSSSGNNSSPGVSS